VSTSLRVLIVDDDLNKRLFIARSVAAVYHDAIIVQCYSGQDALDYVTSAPVDALVTDHSMTPIDGITLIKRMRAYGSKIPIVMVTGDAAISKFALEAGADQVLSSLEIDTTGSTLKSLLAANPKRSAKD
jgi:CheY-like chemotaxis protein